MGRLPVSVMRCDENTASYTTDCLCGYYGVITAEELRRGVSVAKCVFCDTSWEVEDDRDEEEEEEEEEEEQYHDVTQSSSTLVHGIAVEKVAMKNPRHSALRNLVIELFRAQPPQTQLTKSRVRMHANTAFHGEFKDSDYTKVMNDLCRFTHQHGWVLKGSPSDTSDWAVIGL